MKDINELKSKLPQTVEIFTDKVRIIDQLALPRELKFLDLLTVEDSAKAIKTMQVRGAQAIGSVGIGGMYLSALKSSDNKNEILENLKVASNLLVHKTRPTAVNLAWGVNKMFEIAKNSKETDLKKVLFESAKEILEDEIKNNLKIGEHGEQLLSHDSTVLTHCNAGSLSSIWYGTATAPIFSALLKNKKIKVAAGETRPQFQGLKLTAWEMKQVGIDCKVIVDNSAGSLLRSQRVSAVIVGADRIAKNGDTANKIGTYPLAVLAHENKIPFYVCAVDATIDRGIESGEEIQIENRPDEDFWKYLNKDQFDETFTIMNPAFDVTPAKYITKIITEKGVFDPTNIC